MLIIKLFAKFLALLNSETAPSQLAIGIAFGSFVGLSPFFSLHNVLIFLVVCLFRVNLSMFFLSTAVFSILGFILDPLMDHLGYLALVDWTSLRPLWLSFASTPLLPYTNWNNTVVMGSILLSLIAFLPVFFLSIAGIRVYRKKWRSKIAESKLVKSFKATKFYSFYEKYRDLKEKVSIFS